jgi:ketosteroid isomerase-like protein
MALAERAWDFTAREVIVRKSFPQEDAMYRPYSNPAQSGNPYADVESAIRGLALDFCTEFNTGNYDQVAAMFAPEAILMPPMHEPAIGRKPIEAVLRAYRDDGYEDLRMETTRVEYAGDLAVEVGRYTAAILRSNGTSMADRGKYMRAWRRLGVWMIVAYSWSSNLPVIEK